MLIRISRLSIAILLIMVLVSSCSGNKSAATPTPLPTPIVPVKPTYVVERGEVMNAVEFVGRISPVVEEELYFRATGYVGKIYVKRNDEVKAGDLLAELEVNDLKNQILLVETSLQNAISTNEQRIAEAEAALKKAELTLAIVKAGDPTPQVAIAEVGLERAQKALEDTKKRTSNEDVIHEAELNLKIAEAQHQLALQNLDQYKYSVEINQQEVDLARMRLEQIQKGLDIQEIQLSLDRLNNQLNDARLYAPFDGTIMSINLIEGRPAEAYKGAMIIADTSQLEISADLVSSEINQLLQEGMSVTCALYDKPGSEFTGVIRQLPYPYGGGGKVGTEAKDADQSTRITPDQSISELGLKLGDMIRIKAILQYKKDALWLPPQAIRTFDGRKFVVIQDGDVQRRVDVTIGITGQERVEIVEGLEEGQIVIGR